MKTMRGMFSVALVALTGLRASADATGSIVQRAMLPAAVSAVLDSRYPGAKISRLMMETEKGVTLYEAEMKVSGHRVDALIEASGKLREEEAEIAPGDLPVSVRATHARSAQAKWTVERVERVITGAASDPPRYELKVGHGQLHIELVYAADGRRLRARNVAE